MKHRDDCPCFYCEQERAEARRCLKLILAVLLGIALFAVILGLAGCTHLPAVTDPELPAYDGSTPVQYTPFNSGYIAFVTVNGKHEVLITPDRAKREPSAVPYMDGYGNHLFLLDPSVIAAEYDAKTRAETAHLEQAK